jgi:hypothetical protein
MVLLVFLLSSTAVFAKGSSHPTHYSYQQLGVDLIETRERDGISTTHVHNGYYLPENVKARQIEKIEQDKKRKVFSYALIVLSVILSILLLSGMVVLLSDTTDLDEKPDAKQNGLNK